MYLHWRQIKDDNTTNMSVQAIGFSMIPGSVSSNAVESFEQEPLISENTKLYSASFNRAFIAVMTTVFSVGLTTIAGAIYHQLITDGQFDDMSWFHVGTHALPFSVFVFINLSRTLQNLYQCDSGNRSGETSKTQKCHAEITDATKVVYSTILQICFVFFLLLLTRSWGTSNLCVKK